MRRKLTDHFFLDELVLSQTASRKEIDNTPLPEVVANLKRLARTLELVRDLLGGVPILVSSGYRSPALNKAVGGAKNSAHMSGLAADFTAPAFGSVLQVARKVAASDIVYQQVIHEFGAWVHLAIPPDDTVAQRLTLSIFQDTGYLDGIVARPA